MKLSEKQGRKEEILARLQGELIRRTKVERAKPWALGAALLLVFLFWNFWEATPEPTQQDPPKAALPAPPKTLDSEIFIDDRELLDLLAEAGRKEGLVRIGSKAYLASDI